MYNKIIIALMFSSLSVFSQTHQDSIKGPFQRPQDVTKECLTCHESAAAEIMNTRHWNWMGTDKNKPNLGKRNIINNFCIAISSNWPRCTSCHIGYGWKDDSFDFTNSENIDCLICHDQTGTYKKIPTGAGAVSEEVDLLYVAQNVGATTRNNCGTCHFDGGGGTGVKHGDLDNSLYDPPEELDVHMGGLDFQCSECHTAEKHKIMGASHGSMQYGENHISCLNCHSEDLHENEKINNHIKSVACETCHIPDFARIIPTKVWWDWSTAGKEIDDRKDQYGMSTFNKKKGSFKWDKNVVPYYTWYNGEADYYRIGEKIDPSKPVKLNTLKGNINDDNAKITPFKVMKGKQPFDSQNNYLIVPHLFGKDGFWKTFDWVTASEIGMESIGLEFSGSVGFVETEMYWPINHMVAPAENALKCNSCHGKEGRLDWETLGYAGDPKKTNKKNNQRKD